MTRGTFLAAAATLLALASPAHADDRLTQRLYSENEVVKIDGKLGVQATVMFGDNESIENVAVGDSQAWQITPNKRANLLFVKPLEAGARTNMTVVTDKHTYFFDLVASAKARPLYMLRFTYPAVKAPEVDLASLTAAERAALASDPSKNPVDPALLNFSWKRIGDGKIQPTRIYDDGNMTYLLWTDKQTIPAILVMNEKGDEGPVNYSVRGDTIVIDDVPQTILLRSGKAKATLVNGRTTPLPAAAVPPPASASSGAALSQVAAVPPAAGPGQDVANWDITATTVKKD